MTDHLPLVVRDLHMAVDEVTYLGNIGFRPKRTLCPLGVAQVVGGRVTPISTMARLLGFQ